MTSSLATLVNNLSSLAKSAVDAAVQPGADPAPKIIDSVSDMSAEELKRYVPGTVLEMNDNTFGFTPLKRAVVVSASGEIQISFKAHGQAAGVLHPLPWWGQNVKRLVPGVLTGDNAVGSAAAGLAIGGARATLRVANGDPFAELLVSAVGGGEQSTPIAAALQAGDRDPSGARPSGVPK